MKLVRSLLVLTCVIALASCQKEISFDNANPDGSNGGNTGGNNNNPGCNDISMKLKRYQSLVEHENYIELSWNSDGTLQRMTYKDVVSLHRTATYTYENGKISEAAFRTHDDQVYDTAVYHYNADNKVDSIYLKNDDRYNIALSYQEGKLRRFTYYSGTTITSYFDITTDAKDNIVAYTEYWAEPSGFAKQSSSSLVRDDRKNPFTGLAPYMFHFDDDYIIFRYWGPNNHTDVIWHDYGGSGMDMIVGQKYKYNENCYPVSNQTTLMGQVLFTDDDYSYTYY